MSYTVEHTYDDPFVPAFSGATWFPHPTIAAQSTSKDGSYSAPVRALRVTVVSGTGAAALTIIQAGID